MRVDRVAQTAVAVDVARRQGFLDPEGPVVALASNALDRSLRVPELDGRPPASGDVPAGAAGEHEPGIRSGALTRGADEGEVDRRLALGGEPPQLERRPAFRHGLRGELACLLRVAGMTRLA